MTLVGLDVVARNGSDVAITVTRTVWVNPEHVVLVEEASHDANRTVVLTLSRKLEVDDPIDVVLGQLCPA